MVELGGSLRLAAESRQITGRGQIATEEHLDRHRAAQTLLKRPVDHPHATPAEFFEQFIVAECRWQRRDAGQQSARFGRLKTGF